MSTPSAVKQLGNVGHSRTATWAGFASVSAGGFKKIVPASVVIDLECLPPLGFGEAGARETDPIEPVATEIVDATLPHLPPVTADLVRVVLFTGAWIGEICKMRSGDLDRSGDVWIYRPRTHKNKHRGHSREICCGPRTQAILRRYLKENPDSFVFSPREQAEMIRQEKRANRESPVQPSQIDRSRSDSTRTPGEQFNHNVVDHAIRRACKKHGLPHWHPHQFRHLKAQEVTRELGAEAARATLGHRTVKMTAH